MNLQVLQQRLDIIFGDPSLLEIALTHRSFAHENTDPAMALENERLEFLGDAVMGFVVGDYLFHVLPQAPEGEMTPLRAAMVRAETFADFAREWRLDMQMRLGVGEADTGGRQKTQMLCAVFESVIGAIYLDQGLGVVRDLVEPLMAPKLEQVLADSSHREIKGMFQEWVQARWNTTPHYKFVKQEGTAHQPIFTVQVWVEDTMWGEGKGSSKRKAEQVAAEKAMQKVQAQAMVAQKKGSN